MGGGGDLLYVSGHSLVTPPGGVRCINSFAHFVVCKFIRSNARHGDRGSVDPLLELKSSNIVGEEEEEEAVATSLNSGKSDPQTRESNRASCVPRAGGNMAAI